MGGAGSIQHRSGLLRPAFIRPLPLRPVLGGRGRVRPRIQLLGSPAAGEPPVECARRPRRKARRSGRDHSAAAPGNGDRAHRLLPDGRRGDAALGDPASLPGLAPIHEKLPLLEHVIGVAGARESWVQPWEELLDRASPHFAPVDTAAGDPALLVYTSGTTGPPKGALMPQRVLLGNLPGFELSHDLFPQAGDLFWSPADWAWTGGLMDALLPSLYHGTPLLGYRGRFDPEKSFWLMQKYGVRNSFLFPTALKMMMKTVPQPRKRHELSLRSIMSAGESVGEAVFEWSREALGVTVNEMFGQTEINYIVGNSHTLWPAKPGSIGRPYPGHRVACIGEAGEVAAWDEDDPVFFLEYWKNPEATRRKYTGRWCRTGDLAKRDEDGDFWYPGRT